MTTIDITAIDLDATGTVALRKLGGQLGIKGASKMRGQDLRDAIAPIKAEQEAAKAPKPEPKKAKKAKAEKAPKFRKVALTDEEWAMEENGHSDQAHEFIATATPDQLKVGKGWTIKSQADLDAHIAEVREIMEKCPICHPERFAKRPSYAATGRYAVSRAGMVVNVTRRMTAEEKANRVAKEMKSAKITTSKGFLTLTGTGKNGAEVDLMWDHQGRFQHRASRVGGKKVLNVAAALRALGA